HAKPVDAIHLEVRDHHVHVLAVEDVDGFLSRGGGKHVVVRAAKGKLEAFEDVRLVIDEQQIGGHQCFSWELAWELRSCGASSPTASSKWGAWVVSGGAGGRSGTLSKPTNVVVWIEDGERMPPEMINRTASSVE